MPGINPAKLNSIDTRKCVAQRKTLVDQWTRKQSSKKINFLPLSISTESFISSKKLCVGTHQQGAALKLVMHRRCVASIYRTRNMIEEVDSIIFLGFFQ